MSHNTALYQTAQIKELEKLAYTDLQLSEDILMQRAGEAAFAVLRQHWPQAKRIAVFCGKGNNGGDGFVLARLAQQANLRVDIYMLAPLEQLKGAAFQAAKSCEQANIPMQLFATQIAIPADVLVDALLGTGVETEIKADYQRAINFIQSLQKPILSLDLPSGLSANTGKILGTAIKATITTTFIGYKFGLFTADGPACRGEIHRNDLGISETVFAKVPPVATLIEHLEINQALPTRSREAHKGDYGHTLIIGGDYGMPGAARMAGEAAARVGSGLVTVATRPEHVAVINSARPELMCRAVNSAKDLQPLLEKASVIVIGPGLGQSKWSSIMLQTVLNASQPKVLDADALNLLSKHPQQNTAWILTPHPGEAARLLKTTAAKIQSDRLAAATTLQKKYAGVVVLKGAGTIVQGSGIPGLCAAGNPGMASGGMGDVLSGVIGGLLAQGLSLEIAARVGVYVHSLAADRAALEGGERGLLALDLLPYIKRLVNP